ncbi:Serine/threonine-protein kinase rio2 [Diplonema papillatum]|nr:Serine/threonine-protein kinase rio2 [Diplonema papillatum]|eukprot:gene17173-26356_t
MVRLDPSLLRYLEHEDFRVLAAVELASRNHEIAPAMLVEKIAGLKAGGAKKRLRWLLKHNFLMHDKKYYDGYRMNYQAYDYLALKAFVNRKAITSVANKIGVGKESDVYLVGNDEGEEMILKIQRLGRTSFRSVNRNRDYKNGRSVRGESWYYLSRLAATKEYSFMVALHAEGFPVPTPIEQNRHCIVMSKIQGYTLRNVAELMHPQRVFKDAIDLVVRFAQYGLIHGDFNEFNLMITDEEELIVIDFPQMASTNHPNAEMLFNRDIQCIHDYFRRKYKVEFPNYRPKLHVDTERQQSLDKKVQATGYNKLEADRVLDSLLDVNQATAGEDDDEDTDSTTDSDEEAETEGRSRAHASTVSRARYMPHPNDAPALSEDILRDLDVPLQPKDDAEAKDEDVREKDIKTHFNGTDRPLLGEDAEEEEEEEEGEEEEEEDPAARKARIKAYKEQKKLQSSASSTSTRRVRRKVNPNLSVSESGDLEINGEHLKKRIKGILRREEMQVVLRSCKKNTQKPESKRRTKNDINSTTRDLRAGRFD